VPVSVPVPDLSLNLWGGPATRLLGGSQKPGQERERARARASLREEGVRGLACGKACRVLDSARFQRAIEAFDRANAEDPQRLLVAGELRPRELVHAERLSAWVMRLDADASESLRLAARCQHIRRWQIPRASYPSGRVAYLQWRTQLARFHADTAARLLEEAGYERQLIDAVRRINLKQNLRSSPDSQTMEDALCLAFLEFEFAEFHAKYPVEKVIDVVHKTWQKMSARAQEFALTLPLSGESLEIVKRALSAPSS
jgi:Domain of unknown function (DUF4202)